jgi:hypothetical protein
MIQPSAKINLYLIRPLPPGVAAYIHTFARWDSILWLLQARECRTRISYNTSSARIEVILESQP